MRGTVKFWRAESGWGFLQPADSRMDAVFVHSSALQDAKNLIEGAAVEFDIVDSDRRPGSKMAVNVRVLP
jgi:cold shock CspA family protein